MHDKIHELMDRFRENDFCTKRLIEKRVTETGVYRSQHQALMFLGKHPECSQAELSEHLKISPAAVAVTLKKLECGGYVKREYCKGDSRVKKLSVTEKGKEVINQSIEIFKGVERDIFAGFTEEELNTMAGFLERMKNNMEEGKDKK